MSKGILFKNSPFIFIFHLLFGCRTTDFELLSSGQSHSLVVKDCVISNFDPKVTRSLWIKLGPYAWLSCKWGLNWDRSNLLSVPLPNKLQKKWSFPLRISSVNLADLVTFTEEIRNRKLHFLWSVGYSLQIILIYCGIVTNFKMRQIWHNINMILF